jgi:hypothetical protein
MRVKQHLVGLQQIGPDDESAAVAQLEVRHLQLDALAAEDRPVLAPDPMGRWIATSALAKWGCKTTHSGGDHANRSRPTRSADRYPNQSCRNFHLIGIEPLHLADYIAVAGLRRENVKAFNACRGYFCVADAFF